MSLLKFLSETLCMDRNEIIRFSLTSPHRYKIYTIPKRNLKGKRIIAHPSKELKFIQSIIVSYLKDILPVHESAYAYKKGVSIKDNAEVHNRTKYLLKMDFKNFFPSIIPEIFFSISSRLSIEFDDIDKLLLSNFLFCKFTKDDSLKLSIGAPSSPFISNFLMYMFDKEIEEICKDKNINYTRYADDLTFSTNKKNILFGITDIVENALKYNFKDKINLNKEKTIFSSRAHNRHITGITLTNDNKLSLGRERKRVLSSMVHKFTINKLDPDDTLKLQGYLSFAIYIEPSFYQRMCHKYGEDLLIKLKNFRIV